MAATRENGRLVVGLIGVVTAGCGSYVVTASAAPTLEIPSGAAKVCIVRQGAEGALATFPFRDNGVLVGATISGSCFCYFAASGKHELEVRSSGFEHIDLDVKAGSESYIRQSTQAAVGVVRSRLEKMSDEQGKSAFKECQYAVLTEVPDGTYKAKPDMVIVAK